MIKDIKGKGKTLKKGIKVKRKVDEHIDKIILYISNIIFPI
jgi:hypothetical protein